MQERYVATADLGSSKIAMSVARINGDDIQVIYYRETPSDGIRNSCVFNPVRASEALKNAVDQAQKELNIKIMQLVVGLPRDGVRQESAGAKMERSTPGSCISQEEIEAIKGLALDTYSLEDDTKEEIYGAVVQSFTADDLFQQSERDVVGAPADILEGNYRLFIGKKNWVNNLDILLNSLEIAPAHKVFLPQAMAQAVLTDEETDNGVALVEMGGGVTSVSIYKGRILRYYGSIPFGGWNITNDIKLECGFKEELAENIKLAFGACMPEKLQSMGEKILQINDDDTGTYQHLPVKYLSEIITCRTREIIEAILFIIQSSGYADKLRNGIVLTGGGANLANISSLIKDMSGYNVRIGYPRIRRIGTEGCPGIAETSAVASIALLLAACEDQRLNCINAFKKPDSRKEEEPDTRGTVFEEQEPTGKKGSKGKTKTERPDRPKTPSRFRITWNKVEDKLGGLFDEME